MKIADYGKAITSYIESPTTAQKLQAKEKAQTLGRTLLANGSDEVVEIDFASAEDKAFRDMLAAFLYYQKSGGKKTLKEYMRMSTGAGRKGGGREHFRATGGRVHLAEGSEDIVEPSKSMQVDTTTKGLDLFTIDNFKDKAEIYVGALYNGALPTADIKSALNKFTQKGIDDGTFSADDAIKIVQDLKFQFQDRAQKQRLRDVIIEGTGTVEREDFSEGTLKYDYTNPLQKNQYVMRTDEEIQAIIDDPKYKDYTRKDFRNEGILTRKETERETLKFKNFGKKKKVDKRRVQSDKTSKFIKEAQGSQISMDINNNFAHFAPKLKSYLVSTANTGPLKASINRAAEGYDKAIKVIAENQEKLVLEKPKNFKKLLEIENAKALKLAKDANANLPKELKGTLGYFKVSEDGKFKLKGVDKSKTFAGISGDETIFKTDMTAKERKDYGKKQSKIQELIDKNPGLKRASSILGKSVKAAGKVIKPLGIGFGVNAVKNAISQADDQGLELNFIDKIIAFDSGDAEIAINNAKRRVDPEFAAAERAKDLAQMTDDFEEVGQTTFGKFNDQIKNIKLP